MSYVLPPLRGATRTSLLWLLSPLDFRIACMMSSHGVGTGKLNFGGPPGAIHEKEISMKSRKLYPADDLVVLGTSSVWFLTSHFIRKNGFTKIVEDDGDRVGFSLSQNEYGSVNLDFALKEGSVSRRHEFSLTLDTTEMVILIHFLKEALGYAQQADRKDWENLFR